MKVKRESIRIVSELYPRYKPDNTVAVTYAEAYKAGADMPAVVIDQHGRLIDGLHRLMAQDSQNAKEIEVKRVTVKDDADFFKRALEANASHGERYTHIDYANMIIKGKKLGIPLARIATLVHVTPGFLEVVSKDWFGKDNAGHPVALKRTIRHMRGRTLTKGQEEANNKLGGMHPTFYMNQVILLMNNELLDVDSDVTMAKVVELGEAVNDYLRRHVNRTAKAAKK